jgi:tetratricopeptide (TPR) repeat protein
MQRSAEIIHTGYALETERMKLKYKPRLELLRAEYAEASSGRYRAYYGYQLGVVLFILERFDEAHRVFGELDYASLSEHNGFYSHLLAAHVSMKAGDSERALIHCNEMLNITRSEPIAYYTTGLALIHAGEGADGLFMLMGAYDVIEEVGNDARFVVNTGMLLDRLAQLCARGGLDAYARGFRELAAHEDPSPADVQRLMKAMRIGLVTSQRAAAA